jgi:hypothetical protein
MAPSSFLIKIEQRVLDDLRERLDRTRWVGDLGDSGWKYGASVPYMKELVAGRSVARRAEVSGLDRGVSATGGRVCVRAGIAAAGRRGRAQ